MGDDKPRTVKRGNRSEKAGKEPLERMHARLRPRNQLEDAAYGKRRPRWVLDLLQLIGLVIGIALMVHALALLVRAGFDEFDLFSPHVEVGGLHGTRLWALLEALGGAIIIYACIGRVDQTGLRVVGLASAIAGATLLIETNAIHEWTGVHEENGLVALVVGAALLLASWTPVLAIYPKPPPIEPAPWERSRR